MISIAHLYDFQQEAIDWLLGEMESKHSKYVLTMKAPTGSGKTIILLGFIEQYLREHPNTAFVWFCPGKGNLEEQSKEKMERYLPDHQSLSLPEALSEGFPEGSTTFVNWELVTKKGNRAITESEKRNLFDAIKIAHLEGRKFIVLIDEEHSNNTKKADTIIQSFSPIHIIRVSATTAATHPSAFYEIPEADVIAEELITRSIILNEDVDGEHADAETEYSYLLELANEKRKKMAAEYRKEGLDIRPLVLVQLPDKSKDPDETLKNNVLECLDEMGYSVKNHFVAVWLSNEKENLEGIEKNNAEPVFLIMKQAVATGWDCPRAKILVKLRENMGEKFTIQTIGRLRRMPLRRFHEHDLLNHSYVYTFDDEFRLGLLKEGGAYEIKRYFLKSEYETFTCDSEKKDKKRSQADETRVREAFYKHMADKYHLHERDYENNAEKLEANGYLLYGPYKKTSFYSGEVALINDMNEDHLTENVALQPVQTHSDGQSLQHIIGVIARKTKLDYDTVMVIMRWLFYHSIKRKQRILDLNNAEFYAFVINNEEKLIVDWMETVQSKIEQQSWALNEITRIVQFKLPIEQMYLIDPNAKPIRDLPDNVYKDYSTETFIARSQPEKLLEYWLDGRKGVIKWYYKNGDHGKQYLSVVYERSVGDYKEFYPDYLTETINGSIWLLEAKGGQSSSGSSRNIDKDAENKFNALKRFAEYCGYNWGFVREIGPDLLINNTKYSENMDTDDWKPIEEVIK